MTKLQLYIKTSGLTMAGFARIVGVDKARIHSLSTGREILSLKAANKYSKKLGCTIDDLWSYEEYLAYLDSL